MNFTNLRKTLLVLTLVLAVSSGLSFIQGNQVQALTIADRNGIPSSCPHKYPDNTGNCSIAIDSITVNGFLDNDTSYTARTTAVPYGYIIGGQTIQIKWTKQGPDPYYYEVRFGCGNSINLDNDDHHIIDTTQFSSPYSTSWTVPAWVNNYKYCKVWVYAKDNDPFVNVDHPILGVSNTRAFTVQQPTPAPTVTLTASPSSINEGDSSVLSWTSTNATSCVASQGWSGSKNTNGSQSVTPSQTTTYRITCTGQGGSASATATVTVHQQHTFACSVTAIANPNYLSYGQNQVVIEASGSGYTSCTGTSTFTQTDAYHTYTVSCTGDSNHSDCSSSVTVTKDTNPPSLSVSCYATPNPAQINQTVTFQSNVSGGNGNYTYNWSGSASGNNSYAQRSFSSGGNYTAYLTVHDSSNRTGSASCNVNIEHQSLPAPSITFWADKYTLSKGESTYLRWTSNYSSYCIASNGWNGTKSTSNYESTSPSQTTTYTLTCYGNGKHSTKSLTIYIVNNPGKNLSLLQLGRNLSNGSRVYEKVIRVTKGDIIEFYLTVTAGQNKDLSNVVLKDPLPASLRYIAGTTKIDDVIQPDTITTTGLQLGTISRGKSKIVTFHAFSSAPGTYLNSTNTATATADNENPVQDSTTITYSLVAGAATVKTGAGDSFLATFLISLALTILTWYYLKFNPQGQLAFVRMENRIRDWKLNVLRQRMLRNS